MIKVLCLDSAEHKTPCCSSHLHLHFHLCAASTWVLCAIKLFSSHERHQINPLRDSDSRGPGQQYILGFQSLLQRLDDFATRVRSHVLNATATVEAIGKFLRHDLLQQPSRQEKQTLKKSLIVDLLSIFLSLPVPCRRVSRTVSWFFQKC